jgi:hypothetical protein
LTRVEHPSVQHTRCNFTKSMIDAIQTEAESGLDEISGGTR